MGEHSRITRTFKIRTRDPKRDQNNGRKCQQNGRREKPCSSACSGGVEE